MPFAAFPHQINDPIKLRRILQIVKRLLDDHRPIDDETLGYTLFLEGVIKQRRPSEQSLHEQLENIKRKKKSDQSPLTIARDMRRLFFLSGLLENGSWDHNSITEKGRRIARILPESELTEDEKLVWLEGIQNLTLQQAEYHTTFRPLQIMLEMLSDGPIEVKLLAFAFTAIDESNDEIRRIKTIRDRVSSGEISFENELVQNGISESNARNSVKILPALAEHIGLISRNGGIASLTPYGRTVLGRQVAIVPAERPVIERLATIQRRRCPPYIAITTYEDLRRNWGQVGIEAGENDYDPRDEIERGRLLRERTDEHQETVIKILHMYDGRGWRIGYGNFDLLTEKNDVALLYEVKTLTEGNSSDERLRIIIGLGQLIFYENFDIPELLENSAASIQKILFFSRKPNNQDHIDFLTSMEIWCLWLNENGELDGEPNAKEQLQRLLG